MNGVCTAAHVKTLINSWIKHLESVTQSQWQFGANMLSCTAQADQHIMALKKKEKEKRRQVFCFVFLLTVVDCIPNPWIITRRQLEQQVPDYFCLTHTQVFGLWWKKSLSGHISYGVVLFSQILERQKPIPVSTIVSHNQEPETIVDTGAQKLNRWRV